MNMFNPSTIPPRSSLSLPQIIDKATDELLLGADWNVNMQLVDIINRNNETVAADAIKHLKKKLKEYKKVQTQLLAIELIQTLVKNCYNTNKIVANKEFQSEIAQIIQKKKANEKVRERLIDMVHIFAKSFVGTPLRNDFEMTYINLMRSGIEFPPLEGSNPTFTPPEPPGTLKAPTARANTQFPDRLPAPVGTSSLPSESSHQTPQQLYASALEETTLLIDMLNSIDSKESLNSNDIIPDLINNSKTHQTKIMTMIEEGQVTNEQLLEKMLQLNDKIIRCTEKYENIKKGDFRSTPLFSNDSPRENVTNNVNSNNPFFDAPSPKQPAPQQKPNNGGVTSDFDFFNNFTTTTSPNKQPQQQPPVATYKPVVSSDPIPLLSGPPVAKSKSRGSYVSQNNSTKSLTDQFDGLFLDNNNTKTTTNTAAPVSAIDPFGLGTASTSNQTTPLNPFSTTTPPYNPQSQTTPVTGYSYPAYGQPAYSTGQPAYSTGFPATSTSATGQPYAGFPSTAPANTTGTGPMVSYGQAMFPPNYSYGYGAPGYSTGFPATTGTFPAYGGYPGAQTTNTGAMYSAQNSQNKPSTDAQKQNLNSTNFFN